MNRRTAPLLHRDDPDKDPLVGHTKVTREDWLNVARDLLVSDGVAEVKVLALGQRLEVSRSSFYGYFKSRKHLLEALLQDWEQRNTKPILDSTEVPSETITEALCHFFRCFLDPDLFDPGLDAAIREWSRGDGSVRQRILAADGARLKSIAAMFKRHGYTDYDADCRARILYYMQLGYHALDVQETISDRSDRLEGYLRGFSGVEPEAETVARFRKLALSQVKAD